MQRQQHEPLVIAPTVKNLRFRRGYAWVLFLMVGVLGLIACLAWSQGSIATAGLMLTEMFFMVGVLWWFKQQGKFWSVGDSNVAVPRPAYYLTEEGLSVVGSPTLGPIPWDEIRAIRETQFLGFPILKIEGDYGRIRRRLGSKGRFLWLARVPGGIGLNSMAFHQQGSSLATQINAYRESLAPLANHPSE
ncbi:hypothetical protein [Armatimonas sp.]|uniref:hypothetical protein n=1 Tax=Armatimonas sp. TaxID=1872638 RepID=UPI00286BE38A|nr:hypothetical protein [Armatimonas sp.]